MKCHVWCQVCINLLLIIQRTLLTQYQCNDRMGIEQQICNLYMRALQETSTMKYGQKDTKIGLNCIATMDTHHYFSKDRFAFDASEQLRCYVHNTTIYDYNSSRPLFPACYLQFLDSATSFQTIPMLEDQRMGLCSNLTREPLQFYLSCYSDSRTRQIW